MSVAARPLYRRLAEIDRQLRAGSYPNAETLSRDFEVSVRTIRRDLDCLRTDFSAPLDYSPVRNGFFYTRPGFTLPLVQLQESELFALFLAERVLQAYEGAGIAETLARAYSKLMAGLGDSVSVRLEHLCERCAVRLPAWSRQEAKTLARLIRAVAESRQLELTYWTASRDAEQVRKVDPYHLTSVQGEWYLLAYCHWREDIRMFLPRRIRSMRETGARIERPAEFDAQAYLDGSFGVIRGEGEYRVRLRFTESAARYVREKQWHPTQKLRERRDGGVELTMTVTHLLELKRWVLSYGAECEVLAPEELRNELREDLHRALAGYEGSAIHHTTPAKP